MLVTAIMPARGRQEMAAAAVECWRSQTWLETELVIVDDADCPAFPDSPAGDGITYLRLASRQTVGAKRNLACRQASGEIIVHFDSDDYSAPGRIADQVNRLLASGKAVTSYFHLKFTDGKQTWINRNWPGGYGTSLGYRRAWWAKHPFPELQVGEDWEFVAEAMRAGEYVAGDAQDFLIATTHPNNTSPRNVGPNWIPCSTPDFIRC